MSTLVLVCRHHLRVYCEKFAGVCQAKSVMSRQRTQPDPPNSRHGTIEKAI
jgi:hypothetical protein